MSTLPPVPALCVAPKSIYYQLAGVIPFSKKEDARTFQGGMPVVGHPPCRAWSAHCAHQAKPEPGERELGLWCVDQVAKNGGVLEQPAHSRLWAAAQLPDPGKITSKDIWAAEVWQAWWGYPLRKATWLLFVGIAPENVNWPFRLHPCGRDRRAEQLMSRQQRSATTLEFAEWLVSLARISKV